MGPEEKICAIITGQGTGAATGQLNQAKKLGANAVELRMDLITGSKETVETLIQKAHSLGLSCIVTYRDKEEGGKYEGTDKKRLVLDAISLGADFVDIELEHAGTIKAARAPAKKAGCGIIASWHDFGRQPELLAMEKKIQQAKDAGADIAKIAFVAEDDYEKTIDALSDCAEETGIAIIASPMGRHATAGRAYALKKGSAFAYCTLDKDESVAPGVPTVTKLVKKLKNQVDNNG